MKDDVFEELKNTLKTEIDLPVYEFKKCNLSSDEITKIREKERIIFSNFKNYSESLYEICKAVYDVKQFLKKHGENGEMSFVEWYKFNGFTKDKVSELTKRYELYILAPDKIDYISSLSIPAVKFLTKKNIDVEEVETILEMGVTKVDDMTPLITNPPSTPKKTISHKTVRYFEKNIKKCSSIQELQSQKNQLSKLITELKDLQKAIEEKEVEEMNKNNLILFEG